MKGKTFHFAGNFNSAGSSSVRKVNIIKEVDVSNIHRKLPVDNQPANSVIKVVEDGKLITERYYDENGEVYLDIDYTDHGNLKCHPKVPHEHHWHKDSDGKWKHEDYEK